MKTKKFIMYTVTAILACIFCISSQVFAAKTVVVISGVSEDHAIQTRNAAVIDGIKDVLKSEGIVPSFEWLGLEVDPALATPEAKSAAVDKVLANVRAKKPDLLMVLNDAMVGQVVKKVDDLPIVFAWVFYPPQYLGLPKANVTGVTRFSYAADNWILANQLLKAKTVGMLSQDNASMQGVKGMMAAVADKLEAASGVRYKDMVLVKTFDEWKKAVQAFSYDFIYVAYPGDITDKGKVLSRKDVMEWTVANSKVPVIAATEVDVEAGALFSVVTSEKTIGIKAAESAVKILKGAKPADVPYVTSAKGRLVFNIKTAQKYKLDIPYDLLASADRVIE